MNNALPPRIAIVYSGNYEARQSNTLTKPDFSGLFQALTDLGAAPEPAVYHPDFQHDVYDQLRHMDGVLVWVNPIHDGHNRTLLDGMLRDLADAGVYVSAHPDTILKMGTKEVLYTTRNVGWGADTHLYTSLEQLKGELPKRLSGGMARVGMARVLKQNRGNGGLGVWKVELIDDSGAGDDIVTPETRVRVRHAQRGSLDEVMSLGELFERCEQYFEGGGKVIDQSYQTRLPEGMVRCYLVHDKVAGFGHQAINALYPTPQGADPSEAPQPGPRLYHPPTMAEFQRLKQILERDWMPALQETLHLHTDALPVIWDADFLLGPKDTAGEDTYVLCEINVSCVSPYPESAVPFIAQAALTRARMAQNSRQNQV